MLTIAGTPASSNFPLGFFYQFLSRHEEGPTVISDPQRCDSRSDHFTLAEKVSVFFPPEYEFIKEDLKHNSLI